MGGRSMEGHLINVANRSRDPPGPGAYAELLPEARDLLVSCPVAVEGPVVRHGGLKACAVIGLIIFYHSIPTLPRVRYFM